jgi:exodeoxyribonuclease-3
MTRIVSFNVNGIRATAGKLKNGEKTGTPQNNTIQTLIQEHDPDILCFQEIKTQTKSDLLFLSDSYKYIYTNHSKSKKGYSGVAIVSKVKPRCVFQDFDFTTEEDIGSYTHFEFMKEGRILTALYTTFVLVTCYTPNSKDELARLDERLEWEALFRKYLTHLEAKTKLPVILCGDLNVAPQEIDIHNPKGKAKTAGFSPEERAEFQKLLAAGFTDSFRHVHPHTIKYSYWSNFHNARDKNLGWRIDHFVVSSTAKDLITEADCLCDFKGSDHCPVLLGISL